MIRRGSDFAAATLAELRSKDGLLIERRSGAGIRLGGTRGEYRSGSALEAIERRMRRLEELAARDAWLLEKLRG